MSGAIGVLENGPQILTSETKERIWQHENQHNRSKLQKILVVVSIGLVLFLTAGLILKNFCPKEEYEPVHLVLQNPELPHGSEVTCLSMLLTAAGSPVDKEKLYRSCLPCRPLKEQDGVLCGPDPERYYVGDAASEEGSWYCFEEPVIQAAQAWLGGAESDRCAQKMSGLEEIDLLGYAKAETPLMVWITKDYGPLRESSQSWTLPSGGTYTAYQNLHCVVVTGFSEQGYQIADPIRGWQVVEPKLFWQGFDAAGRRAVMIR